MRGGSRIVVVNTASSSVMPPTAMNAPCQSEVAPISGRLTVSTPRNVASTAPPIR